MDEQLKKMLLDAAQKGVNGIENTIAWVGEQAPELLQQLIMYNLIYSGIWVLIGIIGIVTCLRYLPKFWKQAEEESIYEDSGSTKTILIVAALLINILIFTLNIGDFIKCAFAPKLFIFEYVANLIN